MWLDNRLRVRGNNGVIELPELQFGCRELNSRSSQNGLNQCGLLLSVTTFSLGSDRLCLLLGLLELALFCFHSFKRRHITQQRLALPMATP